MADTRRSRCANSGKIKGSLRPRQPRYLWRFQFVPRSRQWHGQRWRTVRASKRGWRGTAFVCRGQDPPPPTTHGAARSTKAV